MNEDARHRLIEEDARHRLNTGHSGKSVCDNFDVNALARQEGPTHYETKRFKGESDDDYRVRLAGELRRNGKVIESHEVFSGRRFDDPHQGIHGPLTGIFGAVAQEMGGNSYSGSDGQRQVGDDIAAGTVIRSGPDIGGGALAMIFSLLGADAGMDFVEGISRDKGSFSYQHLPE